MYRTLERDAEPSPIPTVLKFEIVLGLSDTNPISTGNAAHDVEVSQRHPSEEKTLDLSPKCWIGPETQLNLMIPDRFVNATHPPASLLTLSQLHGYSLHRV
jgi:hypothetical protein